MSFAFAVACAALWMPPVSEPLLFDLATLKALDKVEVRVMERGGPAVYRGVPLSALLRGKLDDPKSMASLRSLSDAVVLVYATDDYQVAVSAAAVAMDAKGERYLLAFERDGKPLDDTQGPAKLIIPGDPERVRWVRNIKGADLIRLRGMRSVSAPEGDR